MKTGDGGSEPPPRHLRMGPPHLPDVRPLDSFSTIKIKLAVLVTAVVTSASTLTWLGLTVHLGPRWTLPGVILLSLIITQVLARGMTSPLREMTQAARRMAAGDYSRRVTATSRDEVGQLAAAFNSMAAELEQSDTARREIIANVSHELRTPVAALRAQLENMVDGVAEPNTETLGAALAQTERLSRLLSQLLDLSRIEAGAAALDREEISVRDLLQTVTAEVAVLGQEKELQFVVDVDPEDLVIVADEGRLRQVLTNLLTNAIRHSPPAGEVTVRGRQLGDQLQLDVVDHGPGIAPEQRAAVFDRFVRGNTPAVTGQISTGGTGLGLAIVRWAVTIHGGRVEVADTVEGTTMRVTLPKNPKARLLRN